MRRTKIVCTLGPASSEVDVIKNMIQNGLDAARINFSHGTYESHTVIINKLKQAREELNAPIPLMLDTKGPEIRIKTFKEDKIYLERGDKFTITTREVEGTKDIVGVTYQDFGSDLSEGSRVLIDDGLIEMIVTGIKDTDVECRVVNGGFLSSNKGVNLPEITVNLPSLTQRDIEDIKFGIRMGFDIIAASFIRSAKDVINIRKVLEENGGSHMTIISKIENREGVNNIDEILEVSDGIMVARGDLGVEIPPEEVPLVQKMLIKKANEASKPVITATQMLESMVSNPRPTRAEANDVANAIFDRTDSIMLSGETAKGDYPVEAVAMMARIAEKTEGNIDYIKKLSAQLKSDQTNITNAISYAACTLAAELKTECIAVVTKSGFTARRISKYRPICPIAASTFDPVVWRQLNLVWGCKPVLAKEIFKANEVFDLAMETAVESGLAKNGDTVVIAIGVPVGVSGSTNTLRVDTVGDVLFKGIGIGERTVSGKARVVSTVSDAEKCFNKGDILVTTTTTNDMLPYMKKAAAVVAGPIEHPEGCHTEIACNALDIPALICGGKVLEVVKDDELVTVDPVKGFLYTGIPEEE